MVTMIITEENKCKLTPEMKHKMYNKVIDALEKRFDAMGYKGKKRHDAQTDAIIGAIAMLDALADSDESQITPLIYFSIIRGEYLTSK